MTERMTPTQFIELADDLLENLSGGLDVMAPEPGDLSEDDSWWLKRKAQAGLSRSRVFKSRSTPQVGFLLSAVP